MISSSLHSLEHALLLSRRMLDLIERGGWEEAAELDQERQYLIRAALALEPQQDVEGKIDLLREIDDLNREMETIGREQKRQLSDQLRRLRQGRRADQAYR